VSEYKRNILGSQIIIYRKEGENWSIDKMDKNIVMLILVLLVASFVSAETLLTSCCSLGYNNTLFNDKHPGVYTIANFNAVEGSHTNAYCDTTSGGGGWLVFQRRKDGSVNFNRDWVDYEDGFGTLTGEFWYGLRALHSLTNEGHWELRIDFERNDGSKDYITYSKFRVGPSNRQYEISVHGFSGVSGQDVLQYIHGANFTTRDRDNDRSRINEENCAVHGYGGNSGGWWYYSCAHTRIRPNHQYNHYYTALLNGTHQPLPFIELKIRPRNCNQYW